jgi:hypothetical protein
MEEDSRRRMAQEQLAAVSTPAHLGVVDTADGDENGSVGDESRIEEQGKFLSLWQWESLI